MGVSGNDCCVFHVANRSRTLLVCMDFDLLFEVFGLFSRRFFLYNKGLSTASRERMSFAGKWSARFRRSLFYIICRNLLDHGTGCCMTGVGGYRCYVAFYPALPLPCLPCPFFSLDFTAMKLYSYVKQIYLTFFHFPCLFRPCLPFSPALFPAFSPQKSPFSPYIEAKTAQKNLSIGKSTNCFIKFSV